MVSRLPSPIAMRVVSFVVLLTVAASASGCGSTASLPVSAGVGPSPELPAPNRSLFPTANVADAVGWRSGQTPTAASGLAVSAFAEGFDHPRWLYVLPNGDVLVAESNAPPEAGTNGLRGRIKKHFAKKAGAAVPSANRITLLRDTDGDGRADVRTAFLQDLASPFGMALVGDRLYVGNSGSLVAFPYQTGQTQITAAADTITTLPAGTYNQHWTRNVIASPDGSRLYVSVGSSSNIGEHGMDEEIGRAAIWEIDVATGAHRIWASGLRNPVGMAWEPETGALWAAVNERDELGGDLVPDYMTSVREGGFYGWPYSYYGDHVDTRVEPQQPDLVAQAISPDYALGPAHGVAGPGLGRVRRAARLPVRHVRRPARVVESPAQEWLQSRVRLIHERPTDRRAARRADGLPEPGRGRGVRPPRRRRRRSGRRAAGGRRHGQHGLARDRRAPGDALTRHRVRLAEVLRQSGRTWCF